MATSSHHPSHGDDAHAHHPGVRSYVLIGAILAVLTFVEVGVYLQKEFFGALEVPLLVGLSTLKIILVVMFFMHLKFESRIFTGVFIAGVILAAFMVSAMILITNYAPHVVV